MRCINQRQLGSNNNSKKELLQEQEQEQQQQQEIQRCYCSPFTSSNNIHAIITTTSTNNSTIINSTDTILTTTTISSGTRAPAAVTTPVPVVPPPNVHHRMKVARRYLVLLSSSTIFLIAASYLLVRVPFVTGVIGPARQGVVNLLTTNTTRLIRFARRPLSLIRRPRTRTVVVVQAQQQQQQQQQPPPTAITSMLTTTVSTAILESSMNNYSCDNNDDNDSIFINLLSTTTTTTTTTPPSASSSSSSSSSTTSSTTILPRKPAFIEFRHHPYYYNPWMLVEAAATDALAASTTDALWTLAVRGGDSSSSGSSSVSEAATTAESVMTLTSDVDVDIVQDEYEQQQEAMVRDDDNSANQTSFMERNTTTATAATGKYRFSLYQKGDGSEEDIDRIPLRYMRMQLDHRERAKHALDETLRWRVEHDTDGVIGRPHPDYDICKAVFPHYFLGHDAHGNVAFVQRPALLNLELAKKNGLSNEGLLDHYVYVNEYLWQIVEAERPLATMTSIIDLHGLNLSVLRQGDIIGFLKVFVKTMDSHFPQRANITLLVNTPKWFHMLYKLLSPLLRESTKSKIFIFTNGPKQDEAFKQQLSEDSLASLPGTFWSHGNTRTSKEKETPEGSDDSSTTTSSHHHTATVSELEHNLRVFTLERLKEAGIEMQGVVY